MADQDLKKQLEHLFTGLEPLSEAKDDHGESEGEHDQLEGIFSQPRRVHSAASTKASALEPPIEETKPDSARHRFSLTERQSEWANDPMLRMAADPDPQVATLALETLGQMGAVVRRRVLGLAQQPVAPLHRGVEAYLAYMLGQPFVYIPPGEFLLGSDPAVDWHADQNELPQQKLSLPGFWMARYPVTVAAFRAFVATGPADLSSPDFENGPDNQPVVDVTWFDALAYGRWLAERSGLPVTLPSEAQWEKAARGNDGRRYPWGNHPPSASVCAFDRTAVGRYSPHGDSIYGCGDMAGNVWEWTRSSYHPYPYQPDDGREALDTGESRVVRGVTFTDLNRFARCAYRYNLKPNLRLRSLGFRLVVDPLYGS